MAGGALEGRVAVVTGAGRGLGRAHALFLAAEGARVVVNDLGTAPDGTGSDRGSGAEAVVAEIQAAGGCAVAGTQDVTDWAEARDLVEMAVSTFGGLHVLVNNAGILRDRSIVNMEEAEWDEVVDVHLKGTFVPLHHAAAYWRDVASSDHSDGNALASVVNVTSTSGLQGNPGQANYGAAKAGVAALTVIAAQELGRHGIRVNAIAPAARTRLTESVPGLDEMVQAPEDARFDEWDPANASPVVGWLASRDCPANGRVFYTFGGCVQLMTGWNREPGVEKAGRWTIAELAEALPPLLD